MAQMTDESTADHVIPLMARWATNKVRVVGSTKIGDDDTGSWNKSTEDADT